MTSYRAARKGEEKLNRELVVYLEEVETND
jgi:hypothetical protein